MKIKLDPNKYTQLNSSTGSFAIQNVGVAKILLVTGVSAPEDTAPPEFVLKTYDVISQNFAKEIFWGKPAGNTEGYAGVTS